MIRLLVALSFCLAACEPSDMGLPTSREETATPANPVSSNTINAIQDAIIGAKRASATYWQPFVPTGMLSNMGTSHLSAQRRTGYKCTANPGELTSAILGLEPGDRITGVKILTKGNSGAASTITPDIEWFNAASLIASGTPLGTVESVGGWYVTNNSILSTNFVEQVYTLPTPLVVLDGYAYFFTVELQQAGAVGEEMISFAMIKDRL